MIDTMKTVEFMAGSAVVSPRVVAFPRAAGPLAAGSYTTYRDTINRIELTRSDAIEFILKNVDKFKQQTLLYIDPPYFEKGRFLYYNSYLAEDHASFAEAILKLKAMHWVISYDEVRPIRELYSGSPWLQYRRL